VDEDAIAISAERLRKTVESTLVNCENQSLKVTISIGATVVKENDTIENILKRVDELMYQAKQSGKNTVVVG
jgi:diguanylate cyclase (GGDEF)-like protein